MADKKEKKKANKALPAEKTENPAKKKPNQKTKKKVKEATAVKEVTAVKETKTVRRVKRGKGTNGDATVKYYPRSFLWNILSITLAFLFGIFAALGGLLGVGIVFVTKKPVKDLLGEEYLNYVREEYSDATLYDLVADIIGTVKELAGSGGEFTFQSINKITPILENVLNPLSEGLLDMGVHLDVNELMDTPISGFGSFLRSTLIDKTELAGFIQPDPNSDSSGLMMSLCYGEEGVDYTVEDGKVVMLNDKNPTKLADFIEDPIGLIKRVTVEAALGVTAESNAAMRLLAYGTEGTNYRINENGEIEMLVNVVTNEPFAKKKLFDLIDGDLPFNDAKLGDLMDIDDNSSGLLGAIKDWTISDLTEQSRIERLKISQVIKLGDNSSQLMKAIADWRIKDLGDQGKVDSLTLSSVLKIDESSPKLLQKLQNAQLGELGDKTNNLRIFDMINESDIESNKILRNLGQSTLKTLSSDIKNLSVHDVFGDDLYSYMLIGEDGKLYKEVAEEYKNNSIYDLNASQILPEKTPSGATITERYRAGSTEVYGGWFTSVDTNIYQRLEKIDVYRMYVWDEDTEQEVTSYYTERERNIFPDIELKRVDYDNGGELVFADYGTAKNGVNGTIASAQGTPYLDGDGKPLYYYTEREVYGSETSGTTEAVYYPLMEDGNGVFCLTASIDGKIVRIDFEETITGYHTESGEALALGEKSGTVQYDGEDLRYYKRAAVVEDGVEIQAESYYLLTKEDASYVYYAKSDEINTGDADEEHFYVSSVYEADEVEVYWTATWDGIDAADGFVYVDRYLSGAWWLIFGNETDEYGSRIEVDNTDHSILEINKEVSSATNTLKGLQLWELYFHGFITENPFCPIGPDDNLNQKTIDQAIYYIKGMLGS